MPRTSKAAIKLITEQEVTSKAFYDKKYRRPTWPGGSSGITVGIGYDLGYASPQKIKSDWGPYLSSVVVDAMKSVVHLTGSRAKDALTKKLKDSIDVPWEVAQAVFQHRDIPEWEATVRAVLPNTEYLSDDSFGALVSLAYNRGASFKRTGDRYLEMAAIRQHMIDRRFDLIPNEIRAMKRLWVGHGLDGLLARREAEATLFERGLNTTLVAVPTPPPIPARPSPSDRPATAGKPTLDARKDAPAIPIAPKAATGLGALLAGVLASLGQHWTIVIGVLVLAAVVAALTWRTK